MKEGKGRKGKGRKKARNTAPVLAWGIMSHRAGMQAWWAGGRASSQVNGVGKAEVVSGVMLHWGRESVPPPWGEVSSWDKCKSSTILSIL